MHTQSQDFINYIKKHVPKFKIAFKDKSRFMKFLSFILFFNKSFMDNYIVTIGYTVYFPSEEKYNANPDAYLNVLTHEFVHMMDYKKYNILFLLSYLLPQILFPTALLSLLAIHHSNYWLLSLLGLLFLAPIPAFFRSHWELRGYVMDAAFQYWETDYSHVPATTTYLDRFLGPGYYYMWPFRKNMEKRFQKMFNKIKNNAILVDKPFRIVHDWTIYFGRIKVHRMRQR